jgi:hypothetical protein
VTLLWQGGSAIVTVSQAGQTVGSPDFSVVGPSCSSEHVPNNGLQGENYVQFQMSGTAQGGPEKMEFHLDVRPSPSAVLTTGLSCGGSNNWSFGGAGREHASWGNDSREFRSLTWNCKGSPVIRGQGSPIDYLVYSGPRLTSLTVTAWLVDGVGNTLKSSTYTCPLGTAATASAVSRRDFPSVPIMALFLFGVGRSRRAFQLRTAN